VNVLPLSDEDEAKEIDNDEFMMYHVDEIEQEPNPNDNFDSIIDFVSNSIKDKVDDTTIVHSLSKLTNGLNNWPHRIYRIQCHMILVEVSFILITTLGQGCR
jgi:hypothetical protein